MASLLLYLLGHERMEVYWSFLLQHWALSSLFVVLLVLLAVTELRNRSFGLPGLVPNELVNLMNHSRAVVIDVREKQIFEQGHILGAMHMVQAELEEKKKTLTKYKSRPIVVVCENGAQSPKIGQWFLAQGFTDVYFLKGGLNQWRSENLPVSKH